MKQRLSEEQIMQLLREEEAATTKADVWRKHGILGWTCYRWRQRYGGLPSRSEAAGGGAGAGN
jgi:putative transposase